MAATTALAALACACAAGDRTAAVNPTEGWRFEAEPSVYSSDGEPAKAADADADDATVRCLRTAPTGSRLPETQCRAESRGGLDNVKNTIDSLVEEARVGG